MLLVSPVECKNVLTPTPRQLAATRRLYESTLAADERISWHVLERSIRNTNPRGLWSRHLILAYQASNPDDVAGYLFGIYLPGFGGYVSYMGVDSRRRGEGIGAKLYQTAFDTFARCALLMNEPCPLTVWESRPPEDGESSGVWTARAKLFDKIGGYWADGLDLWAPNYELAFEPLPYQLFVKPMAEPANEFSPGRIRRVAHDLYRRVYHQEPGDELYARSLAHRPRPRLRPARQAARMAECV